jgi:hypothetical protein
MTTPTPNLFPEVLDDRHRRELIDDCESASYSRAESDAKYPLPQG